MKKSKKLTKKRNQKRNNQKVNKEMLLIGVNAAGLNSKLQSFDTILSELEPSVFFIQESKMKENQQLKTAHSSEYRIFKLRLYYEY